MLHKLTEQKLEANVNGLNPALKQFFLLPFWFHAICRLNASSFYYWQFVVHLPAVDLWLCMVDHHSCYCGLCYCTCHFFLSTTKLIAPLGDIMNTSWNWTWFDWVAAVHETHCTNKAGFPCLEDYHVGFFLPTETELMVDLLGGSSGDHSPLQKQNSVQQDKCSCWNKP